MAVVFDDRPGGKVAVRKAIIFSHEDGREVDGVIDLLRNAEVEIERFNLCQYPRALRFSLSPERVELSSPTAAGWVHNIGEFSFATELVGFDREVALQESEAMLEGVFSRHRCNWLNTPRRIRAAGNKPNQLLLAKQLGIPTPDYLISNDRDAVREFACRHKDVVMKAVKVSFLRYGPRDAWKFYTKSLESSDTLEGLQFAPQIFQQTIHRQTEVRVTVVDGNCFSIGIDCRNLPPGIMDIRELDYSAERARFFAPEGIGSIENWSILLASKLELGYAGIDWAIDVEGRPYFLEANACGAFKWFERCGAGDITRAIAVAIINRCE